MSAGRGKVAAVMRVMAVVTVGVKKVGWAEDGGGSGGRLVGQYPHWADYKVLRADQ